MIFNLIQRDFYAYRKQILFMSGITLVAGMFMIFVNTNLPQMFTSGANSFIIVAILIPFFPELKNGVMLHTASLPVTRKSMVTARYAISLLIGFINLMVWVGVYILLTKLLNTDPKYSMNFTMVVVVWLNLLFNLTLFYFAFYRFNYFGAIVFYLISIFVPLILQANLLPRLQFSVAGFAYSMIPAIVIVGLFMVSYFSSWVYFPKKDL